MVASPIEVGDDRQLFIDGTFFETVDGVDLKMHEPELKEVAIEAERPWETAGIHYSCVLEDGGVFRMWYRSDEGDPQSHRQGRPWTCYAESSDGVRWEKPALGLVEQAGSKANNIVLPTDDIYGINASVMLDPSGGPDERYKMILRRKKPDDDAVDGYVSPDGLHWTAVESNPYLTDKPFDSHNILIWDDESERYAVYLRGIGRSKAGAFKDGHRAIRRSESTDFRTWTEAEMVFEADDQDPDDIHFYTNAAIKYSRASRAFFMFPMILYTGREYPGTSLPGLSDVQLATSRDGVKWDREFRRPFISPGLNEEDWVDRNPIMGPGMIQTSPDEISMYYSARFRSVGNPIRRCTIRTDGFVSAHAGYAGWGEFTTKPLSFSGSELEMNYSTSGGGSILVELQEGDGTAVPGFSLDDCDVVFGDKVAGGVRWNGGPDLSGLSGRPVRMRVRMRDADLYAFKFNE